MGKSQKYILVYHKCLSFSSRLKPKTTKLYNYFN